jgi:tRNA pseudouridine55 synthase
VSAPPSGVLVVDKPSGPTSHDVVERVRKALGQPRAGHTGTLDPFATGALAVCLGKATRLVRFLAEGDKVYRATVRLGFATTTDDRLGEPLGEARPVAVEAAAVQAACLTLTGALMQVPPLYSAKRVAGQRMYDLARQGVEVAREPVPVTVHALDVVECAGDRVELEVRCSPGTYVRALARDLGAALGVGGHLFDLRRTRTGAFSLEQAVGWDDLPRRGRDAVLPMSTLLTEMPAVTVGAEGVAYLKNGRPLGREQVRAGFPEADPPPRLRVLDESGALLALAVPRGFGAAVPGLPLDPVLHTDVVLLDPDRASATGTG